MFKYRFGKWSFPFCCFYIDFCVALATEDLFAILCKGNVHLGIDLVTFDCFCLVLKVFFFLCQCWEMTLDLDFSAKVSWCADLRTKFWFLENDFDWGCFCAISLARNWFLVEVDLFAASWEDNECLDIDLKVIFLKNLDARNWFGKTDGNYFGRFPVSETWLCGCFYTWTWACFDAALACEDFVFLVLEVEFSLNSFCLGWSWVLRPSLVCKYKNIYNESNICSIKLHWLYLKIFIVKNLK